MTTRFSVIGLSCAAATMILLGGCKDPNPPKQEAKKEGIIGKMTDDIGEFKPGESKEADISIDSSSPLQAMTSGAYKNILGRAAQIQITQAINIFNALHDRYPKDHEEFMEQIIKANGITLPVLPGGVQYQYDVENHELKIVERPKE